MTTPSASRKGQYNKRYYPVPKPGSLEIVELPSVTGLLDVISKPGLERWKRWRLAQTLSLRPDLVVLAGSGDLNDSGVRSGAKDAVQQAEDGDQSAANRGTGVHYWVEQIDNDSIMWDMVPEPIKGAVAAYAQAKEDHGWEVLRAEFTCYSHTYGYAGTADQMTRWPKFDDKIHITDVKGGKAVYADYALQLGAYAFADGIWVPGATPISQAAFDQLDRDVKAGVNIPPTPTGKKRAKWTQAAIKTAEAELAEQHWEEYAKNGQHLPLPEDLCEDVCLVIHVGESHCDVVPLYITGLRPAVAGIAALSAFTNNKFIVGEPLTSGRTPTSAPPEGQKCIETGTDVSESVAEPVKSAPPEPAPDQASNGDESVEATIITSQESALGESLEPFPAGTPVPVAETIPRPERVKVYRDRIAALSTEAKRELAFNWPGGVPTFKQSDDQTDEQLELVDKLLWKIECEFAPSSADTQAAIDKVQYAFPGSSVTTA